jgi:hypothetical protein
LKLSINKHSVKGMIKKGLLQKGLDPSAPKGDYNPQAEWR